MPGGQRFQVCTQVRLFTTSPCRRMAIDLVLGHNINDFLCLEHLRRIDVSRHVSHDHGDDNVGVHHRQGGHCVADGNVFPRSPLAVRIEQPLSNTT